MKRIIYTLFFWVIASGIANGQWTKVYQTDSCYCPLKVRSALTGMEFFGIDSGIVTCGGNGGETAVTTDGGLTWNINILNSDIYESDGGGAFTDINHIWFGLENYVFHSRDAGKSWEIDTNNAPMAEGICFYFADSLLGFEGGEGQYMFRTSDGGESWNLVYDSTNGDGSVYQIKFCNPKLGIAICGQLATYVLRTTDSGKTWANLTDVNYFFTGLQPTGLSYPDPHNAWFTNSTDLYHSSDSGLTWTIVSEDPLGYGGFRSSCFLDSIHGIATGGDPDTLKIGYTSDGGQTWQITTLDSEGSYETFTSFPSMNAAYVGGQDAVYKLVPRDLSVLPIPILDWNLNIVPNPASTEITIGVVSSTVVPIKYELYDALGAVRASGEISSRASTVDVHALPSGMYYLRCSAQGYVQSRSISIAR